MAARGDGSKSLIKVRPASSESTLPICQFQDFYDAIIRDDDKQVRDILKTQRNPSAFINTEFDYEYEKTDKSRGVERIRLPFHLAVSAESTHVAEVFIQSGVDCEKCDYVGRNVLHNLITRVAYLHYAQEEGTCSMIAWLIDKVGLELVHKFSRQENQYGLRPVEYAAQQNTLKLMTTLLETQGLHTLGGETKGDTHFMDLDVTEYETSERYTKSPFTMLAYLDEEKLNHPETGEFFQSPIIKGWMAAKTRVDAIPLVIWSLMRLFAFIIYFVADANVMSLSKQHGENASHFVCERLSHVKVEPIFTILVCVLFLIFVTTFLLIETILYIRDRKFGLLKQKYSIYGKKNFISNALFFKVIEYSFCVMLIMQATLLFTSGSIGGNHIIMLILDSIRLAMPLVCIWIIVYPLQLVPHVGPFILSVQGMVADMLKFMLVFFIFLFPYAHGIETFVLTNSQQGCIEDFSNPIETCYTLFKVMLNMVDLGQYDIKNLWALYIMHILYIFIVAILLLNFLVAVMASSAAKIADNEKVILMVSQISVLLDIERTSSWTRRWLYRGLNKLGFTVCDDRVILRYEKCRLAEMLHALQNRA